MNSPRSVLYVPAHRAAMLEKIPSLTADAYIVDLEAGVPPAAKAQARDRVRSACDAGVLGPDCPWMLRINPTGSSWHPADVALAAETRPARVVLPKVEDSADLAAAEVAVRAGAKLAVTLETARGVGRARELVGSHPEVDMVLLGSADLLRSLGATPDDERTWERHALAELLLSARMSGAAAIDGVYFHFRDDSGLRRHARIAKEMGWDGKSCIHPSQIAPIHDVFRSTPSEVEWARRVLEAWSLGGAQGVVVVDGEMVESLHVDIAERILKRA